jgi:hypothetical protein
MAASEILIASTFGDAVNGGSGGGVFALEDGRAQRIDAVSSMGLACDGRRLARILRCNGQDARVAEVIVYDARGVQRYLRLDDAASAHDVAWDGEQLVVVSTWHNAALWFSPGGTIVREVRYPGPTDAWHLNAVACREGVWYATMFGPVGAFGGSLPATREGRGRLVDLATGTTIADGLSAPHTPRWLDGAWLVCNSANDELLEIEAGSGRILRRLACGSWTRGLAWDDDFLYVGTSGRRRTDPGASDAEIVVIGRGTWTVVERIAVPAQEIYDLEFVPRSLHEGLRRGFDVNPQRSAEFRHQRIISELGVEQPRALWPSGDPLPWSEFHCTIACTIPAAPVAGSVFEIPVRVTNGSRSFFTSAPPAPIHVSYKWLDPASGAFLSAARAVRSPLPRTLFPGESIDMTATVAVPETAGSAIVRITLLQEGISWFDDQDPNNAREFNVGIVPAGPPDWRNAAPAVR